MSTGSGQNLNWFFTNWFFTNNYIDLKIDTVKKQSGYYDLYVQNMGGFAIPFDVRLTYEDGTTDAAHSTPEIWKTDQKQQIIKVPAKKVITSIELDGGIFMDYTPEDNIWKK